jgi:gliding motility-associated-like protein
MATPKMQTAYVVKVTNTWGCIAYDTVVLKLQCAVANVHIPNAFTPGGNGKNDVFYVKGSGVNVIRHFRIYNRWGQLIFERNNIGIDDRSAGWDGKFKGQYVETGTYVYMAEMECLTGEMFTFKGTVTIVR